MEFYGTCSGKLCFLAGEIENDGRAIPVSPLKKVDFSRAVPVVRIHVKNLEKTPAVLAEEIVEVYDPWKAANALQIDLDAPESRLDYYRDLMRELKKFLPETELSATVLPCHLKHDQAFRELASECGFFVLQVHGLTRQNNTWSIYDHNEAVRAVTLAKRLGITRGHLSASFRMKTGRTLRDYREELRLQEALTLLLKSNLTCKEIASLSHYGSYSSFFRAFKKKYLVSPEMFREKNL